MYSFLIHVYDSYKQTLVKVKKMKNYELQSFVNILLISPAWSMGSWPFPDEISNATKYETTPIDTAIPFDIGVRSNFRRGRCGSNQKC